MPSRKSVDNLVAKSFSLLQKDFIVIGKERVPSFVAWPIIMFLVGVVVTVAFLASRSGTLEQGLAAESLISVQDILKQKTEELTGAVKSDSSRVRAIVRDRSVLVKKLISENPQGVIDNELGDDIKNLLPVDVQGDIERKVRDTGTIDVLHIDDFEKKKSRYEIHFTSSTNNQVYTLHMPDQSQIPLSEDFVTIHGLALDTS